MDLCSEPICPEPDVARANSLLDKAHDAKLAAQLAELYPGYNISGIDAREILLGGDNIHCITQQIPAVSIRP